MRSENGSKSRRPGRPTTEKVRRECARIAEMLAAGEDEHGIRAELKIGRKSYLHRMRRLRSSALDGRFVWARYLASANEDLRRLSEIADAALAADPPRARLLIRVVETRLRIQRAIIETGQMLGVYPRVPRINGAVGERRPRFRELFGVPGGQRMPEATAIPPDG